MTERSELTEDVVDETSASRTCSSCSRWGRVLVWYKSDPTGGHPIEMPRGECTKFRHVTASGDTCQQWEAIW